MIIIIPCERIAFSSCSSPTEPSGGTRLRNQNYRWVAPWWFFFSDFLWRKTAFLSTTKSPLSGRLMNFSMHSLFSDLWESFEAFEEGTFKRSPNERARVRTFWTRTWIERARESNECSVARSFESWEGRNFWKFLKIWMLTRTFSFSFFLFFDPLDRGVRNVVLQRVREEGKGTRRRNTHAYIPDTIRLAIIL